MYTNLRVVGKPRYEEDKHSSSFWYELHVEDDQGRKVCNITDIKIHMSSGKCFPEVTLTIIDPELDLIFPKDMIKIELDENKVIK